MKSTWNGKPLLIFLAGLTVFSLGCSKSPKGDDAAGNNITGQPESNEAGANDGDFEDAPFAPRLNVGGSRESGNNPAASPPSSAGSTDSPGSSSSLEPPAVSLQPSNLQLPAGADTQQLISFLGESDREIQRLATSGVSGANRDALIEEISRVAKLKQQAAERLLDDSTLAPQLRDLAVSARMQAFSHRAAFGDLAAADALEQYATEMVNSDSPNIARDSRATLIGFALERLMGGVTTQPDEILSLIDDLTRAPETLNGASAKVLQKAMVILNRYGYRDAAEDVRKEIEQAFANTNDKNLAELVAEILADARFNELNLMLAESQEGTTPSSQQWSQAATKVAQQHPDLFTIQYLASVALQLEAMEQHSQAEALYEVLKSVYAGSGDPGFIEIVEEAAEGYATRRDIVGTSYSIPDKIDLSGKQLQPEEFDGKIVLMPFWAVEQMDSLAPLGGLEAIAASQPDTVRLLGVNMDSTPAGQEQAKELATLRMGWPSLAAVDAPTGQPPFITPLAKKFGVVSLPVVVVLDADHKVVAVALGPDRVQQAVDALLQ